MNSSKGYLLENLSLNQVKTIHLIKYAILIPFSTINAKSYFYSKKLHNNQYNNKTSFKYLEISK